MIVVSHQPSIALLGLALPGKCRTSMTKALTYATHLQVPPHRRRRGFGSIFTSENFINAYGCDRIVFVHDLDVVLPLLVACVLAFKTFLLSEHFLLLLTYH